MKRHGQPKNIIGYPMPYRDLSKQFHWISAWDSAISSSLSLITCYIVIPDLLAHRLIEYSSTCYEWHRNNRRAGVHTARQVSWFFFSIIRFVDWEHWSVLKSSIRNWAKPFSYFLSDCFSRHHLLFCPLFLSARRAILPIFSYNFDLCSYHSLFFSAPNVMASLSLSALNFIESSIMLLQLFQATLETL